MDHPFRSAAIGGFNKQDVLAFLEEQSKQAAQAQQELSGQLEEAERQNEDLRREGEELRGRIEELQRELEGVCQERNGLRAQLDAAEKDLAVSRRQVSQTSQDLERALNERDEIWARLNETLPDAQAYVQIKDRTAGVELDAHRRAQAIQEKAESDAQRVRSQLERWLQRMGQEYDAMRSEVEVTVSHAASELDRARAGLERIAQMMDSQEDALEDITRVFHETAAPAKPEAPMPIPEEELR